VEQLGRLRHEHVSALAIVASKSFCKPTMRLSHAMGSFDIQPAWQQFEALGGIGSFDDLDRPAADEASAFLSF